LEQKKPARRLAPIAAQIIQAHSLSDQMGERKIVHGQQKTHKHGARRFRLVRIVLSLAVNVPKLSALSLFGTKVINLSTLQEAAVQ
jgi:hypothetical protein